jgi:hypothetical protein
LQCFFVFKSKQFLAALSLSSLFATP